MLLLAIQSKQHFALSIFNSFSSKHFEKAIERFVYSCAGYCVATFVLVSYNTSY